VSDASAARRDRRSESIGSDARDARSSPAQRVGVGEVPSEASSQVRERPDEPDQKREQRDAAERPPMPRQHITKFLEDTQARLAAQVAYATGAAEPVPLGGTAPRSSRALVARHTADDGLVVSGHRRADFRVRAYASLLEPDVPPGSLLSYQA
jgi:hypothetical protein